MIPSVSVTMSQARYDALTARATKDKATRPEVLRRALDAYVRPPVTTTPPVVPTDATLVGPTDERPDGGKLVLRGGVHTWLRGFTKPTTVTAYPGETVVVDGKGAKMAGTVTAPVTLEGFKVTGYKPTVAETGSQGFSCVLFFGGASKGSVLRRMTFDGCGMDHLGIGVTDMLIEDTAFANSGKNPIRANQAHRTILRRCTFSSFNLGGYPPEPTTAPAKFDRSADVQILDNTVSDGNGAHGFWFDSFCTNPTIARNHGDGTGVGGRKAMADLYFLEIGDGGYVVGNTGTGAETSLRMLDAGNVGTWNNDFGGTVASVWLQRDNRVAGTDAGGVPIETVGHVANNNILRAPLKVYDDGVKKYAAADMFASVRGNTFPSGVAAWWGRRGGQQDAINASQLATTLGARFSPTSADVPADVKALLAS